MKRVFIVTGPESSGTTMLRRALVLSGCHEDMDRWDKTDNIDFTRLPDTLVIHRSIPHGQMWPDLRGIYEIALSQGYTPYPAIMTREINATAKSQVKRGFAQNETEAHKKINWAMQTAVNSLPHFRLISYERFCNSAQFRKWLFVEMWGLPESPIDIWPANDQYYGGLI